MLRQIFTNDVTTIKGHIMRHRQGNGPAVVASLAGRVGTSQVYDVREELSPSSPSRQQQERRFLQELPPLPSPLKQLEVQIHPHAGYWHLAQALYLKVEEEG